MFVVNGGNDLDTNFQKNFTNGKRDTAEKLTLLHVKCPKFLIDRTICFENLMVSQI